MDHLQWPKKHRRVIVTDLAVFELDESKMRLTATAPVEHITQVVPAPSSTTALRLMLSQGKHVDIACASEDDREVWRSLVQNGERLRYHLKLTQSLSGVLHYIVSMSSEPGGDGPRRTQPALAHAL